MKRNIEVMENPERNYVEKGDKRNNGNKDRES